MVEMGLEMVTLKVKPNILEFAMCFDLVVVNTFFTKEMQKLVMYESGGVKTVVDYVLARNVR